MLLEGWEGGSAGSDLNDPHKDWGHACVTPGLGGRYGWILGPTCELQVHYFQKRWEMKKTSGPAHTHYLEPVHRGFVFSVRSYLLFVRLSLIRTDVAALKHRISNQQKSEDCHSSIVCAQVWSKWLKYVEVLRTGRVQNVLENQEALIFQKEVLPGTASAPQHQQPHHHQQPNPTHFHGSLELGTLYKAPAIMDTNSLAFSLSYSCSVVLLPPINLLGKVCCMVWSLRHSLALTSLELHLKLFSRWVGRANYTWEYYLPLGRTSPRQQAWHWEKEPVQG